MINDIMKIGSFTLFKGEGEKFQVLSENGQLITVRVGVLESVLDTIFERSQDEVA